MNALLIAPRFFGYYIDIQDVITAQGYNVDWIPDIPSPKNIAKALGRVLPAVTQPFNYWWFKNKVLPKLSGNDYKLVVFVAGMTLSITPKMVKQMRELLPDARFIFYQWDSERNVPAFRAYHPLFHRVITSDPDDVTDKVQFLPLFIPPEFANVADAHGNTKYDCCYVGTAHPKKLRLINELANLLEPRFPRLFIYHYLPSRLKFFYHKLLNKEYRNSKLSDFKLNKLSRPHIASLVANSNIVLDSPQDNQHGLTFRVFEALGAQRKLITTNSDIVNYDFFDSVNIYVYDGSLIDFDNDFFTLPYRPINSAVRDNYLISSWVKKLIH